MTTQQTLKRTPLYDDHVALGAKMVPFGGWEMPVQYEGILSEYQHTRDAVTLFDISHMGEFIIEGGAVDSGLDRIVTQNIVDLPVKSCRYGAILNESGGIIDDLIIFRLEEKKWFIVVNGARAEKDAQHFKANLTDQATFTDVTFETGKIDIQGPLSREVLSELAPGIKDLDFYTFDFFDLLGEQVLISRTGYTGELGFEIYYPWNKTQKLWRELLKNDKVKAAGLGARDILRLEVGYSLYGHELNEEISPLESGLKRFVDLEKEFIGRDALLKNEVKRKIIGLVSKSRRSPREGQKIFSESNEEVGVVTSGSFAPCLNKGIGLALVNKTDISLGDKILFGNDKKTELATVSKKSFYINGSLKE